MKNALIVEDDDFKAEGLRNFLHQLCEYEVVDTATNIFDAIQSVNDNIYSLILIDMAVPSHSVTTGGGSPESLLSGGIEIILELKSLGRNDPCVIVTQFPDIEISGQYYSLSKAKSEIERQFSFKVLTCIYYSQDRKTWEKELLDAIK